MNWAFRNGQKNVPHREQQVQRLRGIVGMAYNRNFQFLSGRIMAWEGRVARYEAG